jgi:hypothetical protein
MPGKRTGEEREGTNDARALIDIAMTASGQERTSEDVLTLDRAIRIGVSQHSRGQAGQEVRGALGSLE